MPPTTSSPHRDFFLVGRTAPSAAPLSKGPTEEAQTRDQSIVEAWAQGFNVGSVVILILLVLCNYRRGVLLHKLILLELFFALWHGTFIFFRDPEYGWYLSSTAVLLYTSYTLHNVVSWLKIKPFLPRWGGRLFIATLLLVQPYWILEMYANFEYFNSLSQYRIFQTSRFLEPAMRDPWWIFTTVKLCSVIKTNYELSFQELMRASPRFAVLLACMMVSIVFLVTDVVVNATVSTQSGINPFWRLALVFKCASDTIFLDDFKSVLDQIVRSVMGRIAHVPQADYDPSNNSREAHSRHLSFSGQRPSVPREGFGARPSITSRSQRRPSAAGPRVKSSRKRSWIPRKLDQKHGAKKGGGEGGTTPESIRKKSESGESSEGRPHIQQWTTIEYGERTTNPPRDRNMSVTSARMRNMRSQQGEADEEEEDPARGLTYDSTEEILPRYNNSNDKSSAPVAEFEWAMAQEEMLRRGTLDGTTGVRTNLSVEGIPMKPMRARTAGGLF